MWNTVKLKEIVNLDIGKTPARDNPKYWDKNKKSSNIWVSIRDMSAISGLYIGDSREYISDAGAKLFKEVPKNTLIMSFKLSIGKLAITKVNLRTNEAIAAFRIKDETVICKEYLYYYLSSMNWDKIVGQDIKVKGKTLNKTKLKEILILLPPLTEQQRIVAELDAAFAEINKEINLTIQKTENISHLLNSLIKNIFFLKNQKKLPLKDVANIINGYAFKSQDFCNDNTGIKSIKITNVGLNKFEENNKDYLPKEFDEKYSMFKAEKDDLVFALTRSIIKGGLKLAKVPKSYHGALLNQRVALIKVKKNKVLLDYLYFYLHSDIVKKYVINNVNTLMQPNLSINDLKLLPVPLESLEKQKLIIEKLNTIDILLSKNKENLIKKNLNLLQLKSSIIKTYLDGKAA